MIAVIADDLTGAAELAGIGVRYGLTVEMSTRVNPVCSAQLLVITTDTRSTGELEAVAIMRDLTAQLAALKPNFLFKKIDSVLRGHVVAELQAQLAVVQQAAVLVIPANPSLGRTIKDGRYYYNGAPIHHSSFSIDPEFPLKTPEVLEMVRSKIGTVTVNKKTAVLPESGLIIGEVEQQRDLEDWAALADGHVFAAGASGFFTALLKRRLKVTTVQSTGNYPLGEPRLYVSGTTFAKSRDALKTLHRQGGPVSYMPKQLTDLGKEESGIVEWTDEIIRLVEKEGYAIIAIDAAEVNSMEVSAAILRQRKARVVARVLQATAIRELIIEGGSTAAAIIASTGYTTFYPDQELSPGVVRMRVAGEEVYMTVKPGSYEWPEGVWML